MAFFPCLSRKRQSKDIVCACDGLFPLPVEVKVLMELSVRLRCPFSPACRGKGRHGTWRALAIAFSPCLSRKRLSWDLPVEDKTISAHAKYVLVPTGWGALLLYRAHSVGRRLPQGENSFRAPIGARNCIQVSLQGMVSPACVDKKCSCCCSFCSCF